MEVVVVGGWRALSSLLSAVLSPHRHIMRRIMNSATLGGGGGTFKSENKPHIESGGSGGDVRGGSNTKANTARSGK